MLLTYLVGVNGRGPEAGQRLNEFTRRHTAGRPSSFVKDQIDRYTTQLHIVN